MCLFGREEGINTGSDVNSFRRRRSRKKRQRKTQRDGLDSSKRRNEFRREAYVQRRRIMDRGERRRMKEINKNSSVRD